MDFTDCEHRVKVRLLGADPRLWQCSAARGMDVEGCNAIFVEGRPWCDEPSWITTAAATATDFHCVICLDGKCTTVDEKPCRGCGSASTRTPAEVNA